jgi:hypothetical protein
MMNARILLLILCLLTVAQLGTAQTRKIGHRSHSGKPATFAMLMDEDHLGGPVLSLPKFRVESYNLRPWVDSVQRHYDPSHENQSEAEAPIHVRTIENDFPLMLLPIQETEDSIQTTPDQKDGASILQNLGDEEAGGSTEIVTEQEFTLPITAQVSPSNSLSQQNLSGNMLWMLFAFLLFPVAPTVFWLSLIMSNQKKAA